MARIAVFVLRATFIVCGGLSAGGAGAQARPAAARDSVARRDSLTIFHAPPITVSEKGSTLLARPSLSSASLSREDVAAMGGDAEALIAHAKRLAGVHAGTDRVYVDGLPAEQLPAPNRIESITVNADEFSAEYSDGGATRIDITTARPLPRFQVSDVRFTRGSTGDGLNARLSSATSVVGAGLAGPLPGVPLSLTGDAQVTSRHAAQPIVAWVPRAAGVPIQTADVAAVAQRRELWGLGLMPATGEHLRVTAALYSSIEKDANVNVSGLVLPEAGAARRATAREVRATVVGRSSRFLYRGGAGASWWDDEVLANSSAAGIVVPGAFIGGGSPVESQKARRARWTVKHAVTLATRRQWTAGTTVTRRTDARVVRPNPAGQIQFDSPEAYLESAVGGARTGTAIITRGQSDAAYASYVWASFIEGRLIDRSWLMWRGGVRADYQTRGGLLLSPRLSGAALLSRFVVRAGIGVFAEEWSNETFLRAMQAGGAGAQSFVARGVALADLTGDTSTAIALSPIGSRVATRLPPPRHHVSKVSLEYPAGSVVTGVEYRRASATRLLGSRRQRTPVGWTDLLEANRARNSQQVQASARYTRGPLQVVWHYQWMDSRDDTDGPFSFPARQDALLSEWARSTGISRHQTSIVGSVMVRQTLVRFTHTWRAGGPTNLTSGLDAEANGLRTDRGGVPRNSAHGDPHASLDLYAYRRVGVPEFLAPVRRLPRLGAGCQIANLLGNRNYVILGGVVASPSFGQPLAAGPGRSVTCFVGL